LEILTRIGEGFDGGFFSVNVVAASLGTSLV